MNSDIILRKVGEIKENLLPRNVKAIVFDNHIVFVRRIGGRFIPLPIKEQEHLKKKHIK